jgi:integrase
MLMSHKRWSPYTVGKKMKHFKALCKFVSDQGWKAFPWIDKIKTFQGRTKGRRALSGEESSVLLKHLKETKPNDWFPIIYCMLRTGLRMKELVFLEWKDLDFGAGVLKVQPKPDIIADGDPILCKTKESRRAIPMFTDLIELLNGLPRNGRFVFPCQNGSARWGNFKRDFKKAVEDAEIENIETVTPHCLRHSFISQLLQSGKVDIFTASKIAGHASISTTQIYLQLFGDVSKKEALENLPKYDL